MATILIVEDEANQRELYIQELTEEGYNVIGVGDGREALQRVEQGGLDLVVLDISMPGLDGIEAMSEMLARNNKLPIIINTAYASYKDNFRSWSADAYVVKSSDLTELKNKIREVLSKYGRA